MKLRLHMNEPTAASHNAAKVYPDQGALRSELAAFHGLTADHLLITAGADQGLDICCRCCAPDTGALLLDPDFPRYAIHIRNSRLRMVPVPIQPYPFPFPARQYLHAAADRQPAVILISTVSNPTGSVPPKRFMEALHRVAPAALLCIDEVYSHYIGADHAAYAANTPGVVSIRSFSKVGHPGLRVGYVIGHPETLESLRPFVPPLGVATSSLDAARRSLRQAADWGDEVERHIEARRWLAAWLKTQGFATVESPANWLMARFGHEASVVVDGLAAHGILVRLEPHAALAGWIRISTPELPAVKECAQTILEIRNQEKLLAAV
jgi:histidinol-phosphate aminotransferase